MEQLDEMWMWKAKFQKLGIHELLALQEILKELDETNKREYYNNLDDLARRYAQKNKFMKYVIVALELEIGHQENSLEKEYTK